MHAPQSHSRHASSWSGISGGQHTSCHHTSTNVPSQRGRHGGLGKMNEPHLWTARRVVEGKRLQLLSAEIEFLLRAELLQSLQVLP